MNMSNVSNVSKKATSTSIEFSKSGNIVYRIDYQKRTVTAVLKCNESDPLNLFYSQLRKHICGNGVGPVISGMKYIEKYSISPEYIGIAKCHPDDEFDVDFGKRLALIRAKHKYLNALGVKVENLYEWLYNLTERIEHLRDKQYHMFIDNKIKLYELEESKRE